MAVFKPPYATSEERKTVTLEDGELMFDSTEKAFYTGDGTPGGRAINETTITIRNCEALPTGSQASFEETEDSTAQARIYTFYYPEAPDSISIPSPLLSNEEAATPASGRVTPFLRAGENGSVELAVKKEDGSILLVSSGGSASSSIVPAVCTEVNAPFCTVRPVAIGPDGSSSWAGNAVEALLPVWEVPATE